MDPRLLIRERGRFHSNIVPDLESSLVTPATAFQHDIDVH